MKHAAVLFDLGGVVFDGPMSRFAAYEKSAGFPIGLIRRINATNPDGNAWARAERGEISMLTFRRAFEEDARRLGFEVDAQRVLEALHGDVYPEMVTALPRLRGKKGLRLGAATNNMEPLKIGRPDLSGVIGQFDIVVESSVEGVRKPEVGFYQLALDRLGVAAERCIYLDDLGINLKPARQLGMTTIKVMNTRDALTELERLTGISLLSPA